MLNPTVQRQKCFKLDLGCQVLQCFALRLYSKARTDKLRCEHGGNWLASTRGRDSVCLLVTRASVGAAIFFILGIY